MNKNEEKYTKYALCREMLETVDIFKSYNPEAAFDFVKLIDKSRPILFTGEGSSRIFPAKRAIYEANISGRPGRFFTEGSTQAMEYDLSECSVFGASNSGQTNEVIQLFNKLKGENHKALFGLTAGKSTPLESLSRKTEVLSCGGEEAVAATKSVAEQALFYQTIMASLENTPLEGLETAGEMIKEVLTAKIDPAIIEAIAGAETICFSGRNNGVAEELTLKTNEITRKKSSFLEGTYAVHGIEEVLTDKDVLIIVDPFQKEEEKFRKCLVEGVGMKVFSISSKRTIFPSFNIPDGGLFRNYVELAAGWNLLVETGLALGINLDKPARARKVGNEYEG
ncbi:MAG: sugar isomerase [Spirochaetales bacterium]|nr:sugar isomerase [Spirochaetales bacterium]